jgi:nucleoside-diphosphate-sugar epimerase
MSAAKKIVVFTATGEQGTSVCKHLVQEGYHVVGLTRNPESNSAKGEPEGKPPMHTVWLNPTAISQLGVEMFKASLDDPTSYESALEGLHGAFINADCGFTSLTPYTHWCRESTVWARYMSNGLDAHEAGEYESSQTKAAIEACVKAGASHIVYSAMDHTDGLAPHMDSKYKSKLPSWI